MGVCMYICAFVYINLKCYYCLFMSNLCQTRNNRRQACRQLATDRQVGGDGGQLISLAILEMYWKNWDYSSNSVYYITANVNNT